MHSLFLAAFLSLILLPLPPFSVGREAIRLPVLMFIHGESFQWNAGSSYDGSVLSSFGNIVVVTINFRLGVLGKYLDPLDGQAPSFSSSCSVRPSVQVLAVSVEKSLTQIV